MRPTKPPTILAITLLSLLLLSSSFMPITHASASVLATIPVGKGPFGVAYDSGKGEVFVTYSEYSNVSVISDTSNTVVATVAVGQTPQGVAYDSGKGEVFVANNFGSTVSVISDASNTVVATVTVGQGPIGVAYDSGKGEVFVANHLGNTVSVISSTPTTTTTVSTSSGGGGIPEFPYQLLATTLFVLLLVASYSLVRRRTLPSKQVRKSPR